MKFATLTAIGHNMADSLGSGIGLMIGVYDGIDVYGEAAQSTEGCIEVDFLTGLVASGNASPFLSDVVARYAAALPDLCARHGAVVTDFARLDARYSGVWPNETVAVTVEDHSGKASCDTYVGRPAQRPKTLDPLGRVRTASARRSYAQAADGSE